LPHPFNKYNLLFAKLLIYFLGLYITNLNQLQQWEWELTKGVFDGKEVSTCFKWCVKWELCPLEDTIVNPSNLGAQGSEVIVSTRSDRVVLVVRTMSYHLMELPKEDWWSLFAKHAFHCSLPYIFFFIFCFNIYLPISLREQVWISLGNCNIN